MNIAASIMCGNPLEMGKELDRLKKANIDMLHCDMMDGHYVDNLAMGFYQLKAMKQYTDIPLDVHLAVDNPEAHIDTLAKLKVDMVSIHVETTKHLHLTVKKIKDLGMKASVALNPTTPISAIKHILNYVDMILVMTVNPGFEGQVFVEETLEKIQELKQFLKEKNIHPMIQVDGNINEKTIPKVVRAGADTLVLGTSVLFNEDERTYAEKVAAIRKIAALHQQ